MARRSLLVALDRAARAAVRAQRQAELHQQRRLREDLRHQREKLNLQRTRERMDRQLYCVSRSEEAQTMTSEIAERLKCLQRILDLRGQPTQESVFLGLEIQDEPPILAIPAEVETPQPQPQQHAYVAQVRPPAWWERLFLDSARYERGLRTAEQYFKRDYSRWQAEEIARSAKLSNIERQYKNDLEAYQSKVNARHQELQEWKEKYDARDSDAVVSFFEIVLDQSVWPDDFPQDYRIAYEPDSKQLVLDFELPTVDVVPQIVEFRYIKTKDIIEDKRRKPAEIREIYKDIVAATSLRCIHECFSADGGRILDVVTFNGFVDATDPATGNPIRPCLISVRVTRERFGNLLLDRVDLKACLRNLGAQVSQQPAELLPVKPIIEFDMVDKRFINEADVMSALDSRPNLMDLTPSEFEGLVGNLFTRMGLETKLTRTHRDGGVDAIAYDTRPILGGRVVIQAKRYSHTVGVSAVRDLYGNDDERRRQ